MSKDKHKQDRNSEYALVYSTDPLPKTTTQKNAEAPIAWPMKPKLQIEKKGRGGKSVTVASKLPANETLLKDLCSALKRKIGCGGMYYIQEEEGVIEIQGERLDEVRTIVAGYKG